MSFCCYLVCYLCCARSLARVCVCVCVCVSVALAAKFYFVRLMKSTTMYQVLVPGTLFKYHHVERGIIST